MIRRLLPALAALAVVAVVAGCGGGGEPPQVRFAAGPDGVDARPTQYCNLENTDCRNDADAPVSLAVPPGTPLQITVPPEIAETPWQVVFSYRDATSTPIDERTEVFAPDERSDYVLALPAPTDRLLTAQVQQYGPPPVANPETGGIDFPIRASWVLSVTS